MEFLEIEGGSPLHGRVRVQGSKNAALPILAAALLHKGVTVLHNCPQILDVKYMLEILKELGCEIQADKHTLTIDAADIKSLRVPAVLGEKMRSTIILMGSLTGRNKESWIPYPGGCVIGERPIDLHIMGLQQLGIHIEEQDGILHSQTKHIIGSSVTLKKSSVGATENMILAAVLAEGTTQIHGASKEPEIQELCRFLNGKGARIFGQGTNHIRIEGVKELKDSEFTLMADRIVAGTYLMATAATRGRVLLEEAPWDQMTAVLDTVKAIGGAWEVTGQGLMIDGSGVHKPYPYLETGVYPAFPTDLQSLLMAVLCTAEGISIIKERLFESRFQVSSQMNRMGARIIVDSQEAYIQGVNGLTGTHVIVPDLRSGAALVVAGLAAGGKTVVEDHNLIRRGYEDICHDLQQLGGKIRISKP